MHAPAIIQSNSTNRGGPVSSPKLRLLLTSCDTYSQDLYQIWTWGGPECCTSCIPCQMRIQSEHSALYCFCSYQVWRVCISPLISCVQGEGQILTFINKHRQTNTDAGNLLRISIVSWTQLHLGTSFCCFQNTKTSLPHMPDPWLKSLHKFLACIGGSLDLDTLFLPWLR